MAKFIHLDEEFKQNVTEKYNQVKEKVSDAILTEDGSLDTEKIGNAVSDTARKVEADVRRGYQKFSENYRREDGSLDKEKLSDAANTAYRRAGRSLATGVTRLAGKLADKFGVDQEGAIIDSELVSNDPNEE